MKKSQQVAASVSTIRLENSVNAVVKATMVMLCMELQMTVSLAHALMVVLVSSFQMTLWFVLIAQKDMQVNFC